MPWLVDTLAGIALAAVLFALVRFRMAFAPKMRDRYGAWARWTVWVIVVVLMVAAANLSLILLRDVLHERFAILSTLRHEVVFAVTALAAGYLMVSRHVLRNRQPDSKNSGCT